MKIKVSDLLKGFSMWLIKKYHYKVGKKTPRLVKFKMGSAVNYIKFMTCAIEDLGMKPSDFIQYSRPGLLKAFLNKLQEVTTFNNRDEKLQSDIISAFKSYIKYRIAVS